MTQSTGLTHHRLRPGVLFDVDGTLIDSNYLHSLAWSRAFRDAGEWAAMNAIHRLIGMDGDQLVKELLGHPCEAASDARSRRYRELFDDIRPFPAAKELLFDVHAGGLAVVLATSSPEAELAEARRVLDADDVIDSQTSAADVEHAKPAPDVFVTAMKSASVDPARALAVGDSVWDVKAATAAGIACVAVESGGFSRHELSEAGAVAVYRHVGDLKAQLHTSPIQALLTR
ncbi:MAG TPA: HAD family hydrolase [Acidimicrobiia bacterium]|jgi:HAD superfamily hydrolase (TIGR01509 family)